MDLGKRRDDNDDRESKKIKLSDEGEGPAPPSRVVHVRNLPLDCTDFELRLLVPHQLQPIQLLFLKNKGQAFIELRDTETATQFIQLSQVQPPRVRNKQVYLQYSRRQGLDVPAPSSSSSSLPGSGGTIIHVTIIECFYPINVEILCSVFQHPGSILKIIIFTKKDQGNQVSALIQYADPSAASAAKLMMNGKNLYEGCGVLKIQDSNLKELNVEFNNDRSWDFTRQLPPGNQSKQGILPMNPSFQPANVGFHPGVGGPEFSGGNPVLLVGNLNENKVNPDILYALFSCYGDIQRIKILFNKRENALIQFGNSQHASTALRMLNGTVLFGKAMTLATSTKNSIKMPAAGSEEGSGAFNKDFSNSEFHRFKVAGSKNYQNICPPSSTLHVSNIPTPDENKIRELFSQYGHVSGFKFFQNNEKMALVQMSSTPEAVEALVNLHLYQMGDGARLRVSFSKSNV